MNNAWTTIALRASCAACRQPTRWQPVGEVFNSFARQRCERSSLSTLSYKSWARHCDTLLEARHARDHGRSISTTSTLLAKKDIRSKLSAKPRSTRSSPPQVPNSKLRPPQTVVTHTEGVPAVDEEGDGELTWRDYDPAGGMPLPGGELNQADIQAIFGEEEIDVDTGNYILSVLHWRRMSGALIDVGLEFPKSSGVGKEQALKGLEYVRNLVPNIDEQGNGQVWAEEESHRLQEEIQQRAVKLGIYKANAENDLEEESEQGTEYGRERSGQSVLETTRLAKEAQYEKEVAEKKIAEERAEIAALHSIRGPLELGAGVQPETRHLQHTASGGISIHKPQSKAWLQPVERKPWVKYYEEQATLIKSQAVPILSVFQRLGPSFLVLLLVLGASYYLSENYTPPPKSARLWPDVAPSAATLTALTAVLVTTFILGRMPPLWRTYSKYMTLVPAYPYAISMISASLRHDTVLHLASNLVSLWLFGLLLHEDVGRGTFLAVYLSSGALGGFASLTYNVVRQQWLTYIFGSSACVLGVVAAACTLRPSGTIQVFGYDLPIAAWMFLALFTGGEAIAAVRGVKTTIDHAGHLGGIFGGVGIGAYLRQKSTGERSESEPLGGFPITLRDGAEEEDALKAIEKK